MICGCDFCKKIWGSKEEYQTSVDSHWDEVNTIVMDGNQLCLYVPCDDYYYSGIVMDINFCPVCGRQINPKYMATRG